MSTSARQKDVKKALDLSSELPLYEAIKRELKARIESGELPEGTRILPEIELAKQVGVSRSTARKALQALEMEGLLSRTAGRGSFVRSPRREDPGAGEGPGTGTMAVSVPGIDRFNHAGQLVQGFMNDSVTSGFHAVIHPSMSSGADEFEYLLGVRRSGINGWALWLNSSAEKIYGLLRNFQKSGCALVLVERYARTLDADFVVTDNGGMAYQLTSELIKRGHTDIGIVTFPMDNSVNEDRFAGYRRALEEHGLPFQEDMVVMDRIQGTEPLRMLMLGLLGRRRRPTAIFCPFEHHAALLAKELARLEYKIPEDIELAVIDDNRFAESVDFPLIYATQRSYEMGRLASQMLQQRLMNPHLDLQQRFLDFNLSFAPGG